MPLLFVECSQSCHLCHAHHVMDDKCPYQRQTQKSPWGVGSARGGGTGCWAGTISKSQVLVFSVLAILQKVS